MVLDNALMHPFLLGGTNCRFLQEDTRQIDIWWRIEPPVRTTQTQQGNERESVDEGREPLRASTGVSGHSHYQ